MLLDFFYPKFDKLVKSSNSRRANFVIMRRTFRTLNDYEMQHNAEVGLFTKPSILPWLPPTIRPSLSGKAIL
jgi:hypothetical protein